ncbi:HWE histidine kinase domain-containing protein [Sphingosinicella rhizophila]|uniref:histidine kinase n=1 Tax=Sphingosinicella rhizophila TaxID=3050082 RepID=A0ABU3Q6I1_9SPHN|nr:HWE histidine kinase domain-containing protein [Sphingosinicella sp. GR2756]MDT9599015.1 HWE histidine kinase domain-containing protein [Sphingosinicella sp. GR2756]
MASPAVGKGRPVGGGRQQDEEAPFSPSVDDLLMLIGDGVVATDMHGRIILFNRAAEEMFGRTRKDVIMEGIEILLPARFRDDHRRQVVAFASGKPGASRLMGVRREVIGLRNNGEEFWTEATLSRRIVCGRSVNIVVLRDVTERKLLDEQRRIFSSEIAHRMKNNIAVINSVISMMAGYSSSVAHFAEALQGRLAAIANSNELLMAGSGGNADLRHLLNAELGPFLHPDTRNVVLSGPDHLVGSRLAIALSLVVHELVTNSAKYGAFSRIGGRIEIEWGIENEAGRPRLLLQWRESGGPPVHMPTRRGFGTDLIEQMLARSFSGKVDFDYRADGLICRLDVALDRWT